MFHWLLGQTSRQAAAPSAVPILRREVVPDAKSSRHLIIKGRSTAVDGECLSIDKLCYGRTPTAVGHERSTVKF
jgi:hypothetical protein